MNTRLFFLHIKMTVLDYYLSRTLTFKSPMTWVKFVQSKLTSCTELKCRFWASAGLQLLLTGLRYHEWGRFMDIFPFRDPQRQKRGSRLQQMWGRGHNKSSPIQNVLGPKKEDTFEHVLMLQKSPKTEIKSINDSTKHQRVGLSLYKTHF